MMFLFFIFTTNLLNLGYSAIAPSHLDAELVKLVDNIIIVVIVIIAQYFTVKRIIFKY
jgi:putative flippase GtrA